MILNQHHRLMIGTSLALFSSLLRYQATHHAFNNICAPPSCRCLADCKLIAPVLDFFRSSPLQERDGTQQQERERARAGSKPQQVPEVGSGQQQEREELISKARYCIVINARTPSLPLSIIIISRSIITQAATTGCHAAACTIQEAACTIRVQAMLEPQ